MPPRKLKQPKTTLLSLPTELLLLIVQLSAPPPDWTLTRVSHLANLALVCRALRGPAQEQLFRHLVIRSDAQAKLLVAALKPTSGAHLAASVRTLRALGAPSNPPGWGIHRSDPDLERFAIYDIAKACHKMEEMWLVRIREIEWERVAGGPALLSLHACDCKFEPNFVTSTRAREVPTLALRHLSLIRCSVFGIRPASFPHLKALVLHVHNVSLASGWWGIIKFVAGVAPALTSLYLGQFASPEFVPHAHLFKSLLLHLGINEPSLPTPDTLLFLAAFAALPTTSRIHTLRVQPATEVNPFDEPWFSEKIQKILGGSRAAALTPALRHVRLPHSLQPHEAAITRMVNEAPYEDITVDFDPPSTTTFAADHAQGFYPLFWDAVDEVEAEERSGSRRVRVEGM
ncbi:hypothetical protein RQP46_009821 [Phenoliferia psychrophenolica]